jgi:hypothetical protein
MARRKNYYAFTDFNYTDGASELFNNTIRNAFEYDAYTSDIFEARVIYKTQFPRGKFIYRIRILGNLSPHRFIEDPCSLETAVVEEQKQIFNNLLSLHTKLITDQELNEFDIIRVRLERSGQSFNLVETKQFIEVVQEGGENLQGEERNLFNKCEKLFTKAAEFDEASGASPGPTPIGEPLDQSKLDAMMNNFYDAFRNFLISRSIIQIKNFKNPSRTRTTMEGRQMIMRMGLAQSVPEVLQLIADNEELFDEGPAKRKFKNFDDTLLTFELTETVKNAVTKKTGQKIATPERSSHHPATGYIAMDFQYTNQPKPGSFKLLLAEAEAFKLDPTYQSLELEIFKFVLEPYNGVSQCGSGKCGVLHIDFVPSDPTSAEYMRNYSTINPYTEFEEDTMVDSSTQDEIDLLYPVLEEPATSDPAAPPGESITDPIEAPPESPT